SFPPREANIVPISNKPRELKANKKNTITKVATNIGS
ncbi:hypothetical protein CP8484711_2285B, partial [Chlamydia psittaci 84-8471/1]